MAETVGKGGMEEGCEWVLTCGPGPPAFLWGGWSNGGRTAGLEGHLQEKIRCI